MEQPILELKNISKSFNGNKVLNGLNLSIERGEFVTLLGSSGCGKTTTLRIIAGLESADSGQVFLEGTDVTGLEPNKRSVNTVFQNYALFPHMNVEKNIGYSLKLKKVKKELIEETVKEALKLVQLEGYEKRMPNELSGGQKQRVAIARALVNKPKILLLDEPLGALDLQLRRQMQTELKRLQKQLGITFIYITHDQEEALNMSDRIIIMKEGSFEQIGTPKEIYDNPVSSYTAQFVGNSNIIKGTVSEIKDDFLVMKLYSRNLKIAISDMQKQLIGVGDLITASFHSEAADVLTSPDENCISGTIIEKTFVGGILKITARVSDDVIITANRYGFLTDLNIGDPVYFSLDYKAVTIVDLKK